MALVNQFSPSLAPIRGIFASGLTAWQSKPEKFKRLTGKMEVNIVLRWDRHAIPSCRMKAPVTQNGYNTVIHALAKPLKKAFCHHRSLRVNRNFHDYIALNSARQL
jgi:hypothetical protein